MLSQKPWTLEMMLRLLLGVIICLCLGSVAVSSWHYAGPGGRQHVGFIAIAAMAVVLLATALVVASQRWRMEDLLRRLLLMFACLSAGLSLAAWAQKIAGRPSEGSSSEQMVVAETAVLAFFIGFLRAQRGSWSDAFGLANRPR